MNGPDHFQKVGRRASVDKYDFQVPPSEFSRQQVEKLELEEGPLGKHLEVNSSNPSSHWRNTN